MKFVSPVMLRGTAFCYGAKHTFGYVLEITATTSTQVSPAEYAEERVREYFVAENRRAK